MRIDTKSIVSMNDATTDFSKVARLVDEQGSAVIFKNDIPRYLVIEFSQVDDNQEVSESELLEISKKLIERNKTVYEELAK